MDIILNLIPYRKTNGDQYQLKASFTFVLSFPLSIHGRTHVHRCTHTHARTHIHTHTHTQPASSTLTHSSSGKSSPVSGHLIEVVKRNRWSVCGDSRVAVQTRDRHVRKQRYEPWRSGHTWRSAGSAVVQWTVSASWRWNGQRCLNSLKPSTARNRRSVSLLNTA